MLNFEDSWRFTSPGPIGRGVVHDFYDFIAKIARSEQGILEHFKRYFAGAAGLTSHRSSNYSWADSDLQNYMDGAAENAPLFIEAFHDACEDLKDPDNPVPVPDLRTINAVLAKHDTHFRIDPPNLIHTAGLGPVTAPEIPETLEQKTQTLIKESFEEAKKLLGEGRNRLAVQELLWLLETVTTVFQGTGEGENTIKGKYFNQLVTELRERSRGKSLDMALKWLRELHGYLSAPNGGGIRHGMHLKDGVATTPEEARYYCDLIVVNISFLLAEYKNLVKSVQ